MMILTMTSVKDITNDDELDTLIGLIADGNRDALAELYELTRSAVYSFALSILKNTHDAEDVLHDCYVSVWQHAAAYVSSGKPMAWIITITKNLCLGRLRQHKKNADMPEEDWMIYVENHEEASPEDKLILKECLGSLSDEERNIVVLYAVSGFKHREIAELLNLPLATVLSKYHRAMKKLRKIME